MPQSLRKPDTGNGHRPDRLSLDDGWVLLRRREPTPGRGLTANGGDKSDEQDNIKQTIITVPSWQDGMRLPVS